MSSVDPRTTIIVQRVEEYAEPDTSEIRELVRAAGFDIADEIVQQREEDPEYHIGSGKVDELSERARRFDADLVVFDNRLGPYQTYNIGLRLPGETPVVDRFRLILEIFAQRADTRKAQLQVELAQLRYELPRAEAKVSLAKRNERPGFMGLGEYDESIEKDIKKRISHIKTELDQIEQAEQHRRERQREAGFDLVALAGYTNAGKSTLMQRMAAELEVGQNKDLHPDLDPTAEVHDQLFTTLGTTTRRMELEKREALITDTVGFLGDLPHWMVESFKPTLASVYRADLIVLVVDVTDPVPEMREKLITCLDVLHSRNEGRVVAVLNKVDCLPSEEVTRKRELLQDMVANPVCVSAKEGKNIDELIQRIENELPSLDRERLYVSVSDSTMSLISWIHDNAHVNDVSYTGNHVVIDFEAKPDVVEKARSLASDVAERNEKRKSTGCDR